MITTPTVTSSAILSPRSVAPLVCSLSSERNGTSLFIDIHETDLAPWYPRVKRRILDSIATNSGEILDGEHLSKEVAQAAVELFRQVSNVLPIEPYMYASTTGGLVAEFQGASGLMTIIIDESKISVFASLDDRIEKAYFSQGDRRVGQLLFGFSARLMPTR